MRSRRGPAQETPGPRPEPLTPAQDGAEGEPRAAPGEGARPTRPRRGYWIPGLIAVAVLTALGVALGAGDLKHTSPKLLYGKDVAQQIALGIQAKEGSNSPPDVRCPATEPVRDGWQFVCTRPKPGKAGAVQEVQVVEIDRRGHLRWSLGN